MSDLGLQLHAALEGRFETEVAEGRRRTEGALYQASVAYGGEVQDKWRADVAASGLAE